MSEYRYHPEIPGLKVNENGSEVLMNELPVSLKERNRGKHPFKFFYYKEHQIGLAKLIIECWQGMAPEPKFTAKHIDGDYTNYHHENLRWGTSGGNAKYPPKLTQDQKKEILEKIATGLSDPAIAKEYKVCKSVIRNIRIKEVK